MDGVFSIITIFLMPGLIVFTGAGVWWRRRLIR